MTAIGFRQSRGSRERRWLVPALCAGVLVVLAVAWMYFAWPSGGRPGSSGPGGDRAPSAARISRAGGAPPGRAASQAAPETGSPVVSLRGLLWRGFHGIELPASPAAGPLAVRSGLAWGFARTPLGALLAAVNIGVRANAQWGPRVFVPTIRGQVTGPGAALLLAGCRAAYEQARRLAGVPEGEPLGRVLVVEQAFRWVTYGPHAAVVDIVSAGLDSHGGLVRAVTRVAVVWRRGDWRVVAPPGGDWGGAAAPVRSLRGYTIFAVPGRGRAR